jgi:hypothetical protein
MEEIKLEGLEEIKLNVDSLPSSNFGPGAELLMNGRQHDGPKDIHITDLDSLERELNELSEKPSFKEATKTMFSMPNISVPSVNFAEPVKEPTRTWDGYTNQAFETDKKPEVKEDTLREKFKFLRKLEDLQSKGVTLTKTYSMDSSLDEMQGEYEHIISEKERTNSVRFQGKMLMACITGLEFLNHKVDPFDLKLDGWAEQVNENITDYDEIFAELHEKYRSKAKMAPELKLLFQLGGGAMMLHMTNTMFKSSLPGMDDIMRQNPELMQKFTQAAVNSMGNTNPGFTGFMNNVMPNMQSAPPQHTSYVNRDRAQPDKRPDMRGPTDINDILSGLKPKQSEDATSTVSLSELKDMKDGLMKPRRKKSDKHTVNLDI